MSLLRYFGSRLRQRAAPMLAARRRPVITLRPLCDICGRYLDSEQITETWPTGARVLGRHHGAEELASFELGIRDWEPEDLQGAMRGHRWFQPETRAEHELPPNHEPGLSTEVLTVPAKRKLT